MNKLNIYLLQNICDFLDYSSQKSFINSCLFNKYNLQLTNLDVPLYLTKKLDYNNINNKSYLISLNLYENRKITTLDNINHIINLKIGNCLINNNSIKHLITLESLDISNNYNRFDLSLFTNLKYLDICGMVNIDYNDLLKLPKLKQIRVYVNPDKKEIYKLLENTKIKIIE